MKRTIILPIMLIMLSLAVSAAECSDGMAINMSGGESFDCHFTECVNNLVVDISINPWQNMTPTATEYWLNPGCTNVAPLPAQSTFYPNIIRWSCPCTDDYTFNLTTALNSNGTYHITFNQTIIEYGPQLDPIPNSAIQETGLLTITLSANDNDTAQSGLSYSTDASFGSMAGNVYTWQTDYSSEGTYNITFSVFDGKYYGNQTLYLAVTHKDEPSPPPDDGGNTGGGGGGGGGGGYIPFEGRTPGTGPTTPTTPSNPLAGAAGTEGAGIEAGEAGGLGGITGQAVGENEITGNAVSEKAPGKGSWKVIGILFWLAALVMLIMLIVGRKKKPETADGNIE